MTQPSSRRNRPRKDSILKVIDRNAVFIAFSFVYAGLLSSWAIPFIPEDYKATARIEFIPAELNMRDVRDYEIKREIRDMRSASFKNKVEESIYMQRYASNSAAHQKSFKSLNIDAAALNDIQPAAGPEDASDSLDLSKIIINRAENSPVIEISYRSKNPANAAKAVNQYALSYLEQHYTDSKSTGKAASIINAVATPVSNQSIIFQKLTSHLDGLVNAYFDDSNFQNEISYLSQLASLELQEKMAHKEQADLLKEQKSLLSKIEKPSSSVTRASYAAQKQAETDLAPLSKRYGYKHPKIVALQDIIAQHKTKRSAEVWKLKKKYQGKLEKLEDELAKLDNRSKFFAQQKETLVSAKALKSSIHKEQYNNLLLVKQLVSGLAPTSPLYQNASAYYEGAKESKPTTLPYKVEVSSLATAPSKPEIPKRHIALAMITLATLLLVLMIISIKERVRVLRYYSSLDLEEDTSLPCVAGIPDITKLCTVSNLERTKTPPPGVEQGLSALAIKLDSKHASSGDNGYVVTLTSSISNEGKTQTLLWLARVYANAGKRVIILDGNLREPNLHEATGRGNTTSIVDYLTQKKTLDEIIHMNERLNIDMIFSQKTPDNANRLLSSSKMSDLVYDLKRRYDVVLIDTPSCLTYADALVFAKLSDQVLYNVRYGKTKRESVSQGLGQIQNALKTPVAFILAQVDPSQKKELHYI